MKNLLRSSVLLFCLFVSITCCPAVEIGDESPDDIARRLQHRYDNITSITFVFHQDTKGEMTGRPRQGSGSAMFFRDGDRNYMRWDYSSPEKQVLLSDGDNFSMYFSNLQQMIISPAENFDADLTYSFFTGRGNIQRDFHIRPADMEFQSQEDTALKAIKIIPKVAQSQVQDIHLWVTEDSLIRRIRIVDHFGTITTLNFSDIKIGSLNGLPAAELKSLFTFVAPEGTEVINQ